MLDAVSAEAGELRKRQPRRPQPGAGAGCPDVERDQPAVVQTGDDCGHFGGLDRPLDDLALRINRAVLELRQAISPPRPPIPSHPPSVDG